MAWGTKGTGDYNARLEPCDGLASHPRGSSNIPSCFMLRKRALSTGLMDHLVPKQTLPYRPGLHQKFCSITN